MTRAGEFNRSITIRAATRVEDEYGGASETASDVATVRAKVRPLEGTEQLQAMQTGMSAPHEFTIRWRDDVTGATEVAYDGRTFNVTSVTDPDARHRELILLADEVR